MKAARFSALILVPLFLSLGGVRPASAQLPSLDDSPWLGYFAGYANKRFRFGINSYGQITLIALGGKDQSIAKKLQVSIKARVEEVLSDGKTEVRKIVPETLESAQPKTGNLEKVVVRGKVAGDASYEITLEQKNGAISIGGRVLNPGRLTEHPLRFAVEIEVPSVYAGEKKKKEESKRGRRNAFQEKIKDDRIDLKRTDGSRKRYKSDDKVEASSKEVNGPGVAAAKIEMSAYKGRKFQFLASEGTSMTFSNETAAPWHEGFKIRWVPDAANDPEGRARLTIEVK